MTRIGLVAVAFLAGTLAQAEDILPLRNHRSSALVFLRPLPLGPVLKSGTETRWTFAAANELRDHPEVYEDLETWRFAYFYRETLDGHSEWFVEAPFLVRHGGVFDPLLDWWHRVFIDDGNPQRAETPYGLTNVRVPGLQSGEAAGLGDLTLGYGRNIDVADARIWFKVPTGDPNRLLGSGGLDAAVSLDRAWTLGPSLRLSAHAGLTAQGRPADLRHARGLAESAALALAYKPNSRDVWLLQWNSEPSPTRIGNPQLDAAHRLITFGYTRKSGDTQWSLALMQDGDFGWLDFPGGAQIGPDLTLAFNFLIRK